MVDKKTNKMNDGEPMASNVSAHIITKRMAKDNKSIVCFIC